MTIPSKYLTMRLMNEPLPEKLLGEGHLKIIFLISEDWYFLSHRLALARACRDLGWEVIVATHVDDRGAEIEREGFRLISLRMRRRNRAPWKELPSILELAQFLRREKPDILYQVGLKPVIYGGLVSIFVHPPAVVNLLAGMGYIFTGNLELAKKIGLKPKRRIEFFTSKIECRLLEYELY